MSLKDTIRSKMYECMKENNKADKAVYSMLLDNIQKAEKNALCNYTDDDIIRVIQKQVKQCNETLEFAKKGNKAGIVTETENEIAILSTFLPKMMTAEEIAIFIDGIADEIEPIKNNKGKYMKACAELRGKADMKIVAQIVDSILA